MESRYYPGVEADVIKLMTELRDLFDEDFDIQTMNVSSTAVLQARKSSTLRDFTGLSAALTIKVTPETGGTRVEIGMQKWFDKAAIAAVAMVVFPVLMALPAIGAYWQYKITEDAWQRIEDHIARKAEATCRPCRAAVQSAARRITRARRIVPGAARNCVPVFRAHTVTRFKKTRPRGFAIPAEKV